MKNEYAVVRLKKPMPSVPLKPGTSGTILLVYPCHPPAYEVEFVDDAGNSLGTFTVADENLEEAE